jgi:hypothetical protein
VSIRSTVGCRCSQILFGARISEDTTYNSQLETIAVAYVLNLVVIGAVLFLVLAKYVGSTLGKWVAISNVLSFALIYFSSRGWNVNHKVVEHLSSVAQVQGYHHSSRYRVLIVAALLIWGAFSLILMAGLFYTLGRGLLDDLSFGNLLASIGANILLLHAMFVRRSIKTVFLIP